MVVREHKNNPIGLLPAEKGTRRMSDENFATIGCRDCLSPALSLINTRGDTTPKLVGDGKTSSIPRGVSPSIWRGQY
jgi:hypothetical protein